jgi:hypothetical protein
MSVKTTFIRNIKSSKFETGIFGTQVYCTLTGEYSHIFLKIWDVLQVHCAFPEQFEDFILLVIPNLPPKVSLSVSCNFI